MFYQKFKLILKNSRLQRPISPKMSLAICLYKLSRGDYNYTISEMTGVGKSTVISEAVAQRCSVKKVFLKFRKIHRKTPVPEPLFNKVAGLRPATLLKKRLWHRCFPVNFAKFLRTPFLTEHLRWLLLEFVDKVCF